MYGYAIEEKIIYLRRGKSWMGHHIGFAAIKGLQES